MDWYLNHFHLFYLLVCILACGQCRSIQKRAPEVSDSLHIFANDLYQAMDRSEGNTLVSPLSVYTSLSMVSLGAKGSTLDEIRRTLRLSPDALSRMGGVIASLQDVEGFDMANFLWVPRGVVLRADFAKQMSAIFKTRVRDADFKRSELVRSLINQKISNVTRGLIQEFLPTGAVTKETKAMLANAIYFKGQWLHPFQESLTESKPFFTSSSQSVNVPMMRTTDTFIGGTFGDLDCKAVLMSYKDNRFGLLMVLPNRYDGLNELETKLRNANHTATSLLRKMIHRDVDIVLPRFKIHYGLDMTNKLKQMGITELFSNDADLTGISRSPLAQSMKVSNVYHRATIEINEGGSEASASSGLEIIPLSGSVDQSGPIEFHADHPFMFYLIDRDNENTPVFMGRVTNPLDGSQSQSSALYQPFDRSNGYSGSDKVIYPGPAVEGSLISRVTRESGDKADVPEAAETPQNPELADLILRVKDKNWFKKPTVPDVIIPTKNVPPLLLAANPNRPTTTPSSAITTRRWRKPFTTRSPYAYGPSVNAPRPSTAAFRPVQQAPTQARPTTTATSTTTTTGATPTTTTTTSLVPSVPDSSAFAFEESSEEVDSSYSPNPGLPSINTWMQPQHHPENGIFNGLFRPLQSWPLSAVPNGPISPNGQPLQPISPNGQPLQPISPGSDVFFPNLRIVTKNISDRVEATFQSIATALGTQPFAA